MHLWRTRTSSFGVALALVLVWAGTAVAQDEPPPVATVNIELYRYQPKELVVTTGTTLTWTNLDTVAHTVTADDQAFDSMFFSKDESWSMTFDTAGTYGYYCIPHGSPGSGMFGTVVVVDPQ